MPTRSVWIHWILQQVTTLIVWTVLDTSSNAHNVRLAQLDVSTNDLETKKANRADPTFTGVLTAEDASFNENVYIAKNLTVDGDLSVKSYNNGVYC